ncbi:MAG: hypothetical protein QMD20_04340 [Candidatus Bathyarchaeia archaeon]|nr:hypothetical protein [Candidatus Bathyarchaeia archaeon]
MSFREYLHEKAEESRHNESVAYLMFLAGVVFFVGGMLETISLAKSILLGEPEWFIFIHIMHKRIPVQSWDWP